MYDWAARRERNGLVGTDEGTDTRWTKWADETDSTDWTDGTDLTDRADEAECTDFSTYNLWVATLSDLFTIGFI